MAVLVTSLSKIFKICKTWLTGGQTQSARSNMDFIDLEFESFQINFDGFWNCFYFKTCAKQSSKLLTLVTDRSAHICHKWSHLSQNLQLLTIIIWNNWSQYFEQHGAGRAGTLANGGPKTVVFVSFSRRNDTFCPPFSWRTKIVSAPIGLVQAWGSAFALDPAAQAS